MTTTDVRLLISRGHFVRLAEEVELLRIRLAAEETRGRERVTADAEAGESAS